MAIATFVSIAVPSEEIPAHSDGAVHIATDMWLCMQRGMDEHLICAMPKHTLKTHHSTHTYTHITTHIPG